MGDGVAVGSAETVDAGLAVGVSDTGAEHDEHAKVVASMSSTSQDLAPDDESGNGR